MSALMKYHVFRKADEVLRGVYCKLTGEIDDHDTPEVEASLREWIDSHGGSVTLDIREVKYHSSSVLRMLLRLHAETVRRGEPLVLITNAFQDRLLKIVRMDRLLTTTKTREEAAALLGARSHLLFPSPPLGIPV